MTIDQIKAKRALANLQKKKQEQQNRFKLALIAKRKLNANDFFNSKIL